MSKGVISLAPYGRRFEVPSRSNRHCVRGDKPDNQPSRLLPRGIFVNEMSVVPLHPPPLPPAPVSFSGDRREFFRLVRNGTLLELVTFGFYRFWLATDIRRHLWSHTSIDGDAP